jgi:hypothetical protein
MIEQKISLVQLRSLSWKAKKNTEKNGGFKLTKREFISADIELSGDFNEDEIETIKTAMDNPEHQSWLDSNMESGLDGYRVVDEFYQSYS